MNQPIPRSFFKDGQRAILRGMKGKIVVENGNGIAFLEDGQDELRVLMVKELMYLHDDLELLDRTIDQVMEGDLIESPREEYKLHVLGRCGNVVMHSRPYNHSEYESSSSVQQLKNWGWTISQPSNPEVMTDETAKALREEAMRKVYLPKQRDRYWYWSYGEGMAISDIWYTTNLDIARYYTANTHKTKSSAEYYGKHYAPAFLHVFKE
jgi:hypothetical protein